MSAESTDTPQAARNKVRARKSYSTSSIAAALEKRYPTLQSAYAILYEVGNGTGANCGRHADALVMSLWPSRGLWLAGFEFKASRSDWLKEHANPAKADAIQRYCDFWWLAVTDPKIVQDGELPQNWGLMALDSRGSLRVIKDAPRLAPVEIDRSFLGAIMRRIAEPVAAMARLDLRQEYERGRKEAVDQYERETATLREELAKLERQVFDFERASGIATNIECRAKWRYSRDVSPHDVGAAVRLLADGGLTSELLRIQGMERQLRDAADQLAAAVEVARKVEGDPVLARSAGKDGEGKEQDRSS